jgi:hypothetical protein
MAKKAKIGQKGQNYQKKAKKAKFVKKKLKLAKNRLFSKFGFLGKKNFTRELEEL